MMNTNPGNRGAKLKRVFKKPSREGRKYSFPA
jgi:hypothetical protein